MNTITSCLKLSSSLRTVLNHEKDIMIRQRFLKFSSEINTMGKLREKLSSKCFGGYQKIFAHDSQVTNCEMRFAIYLPPQSKDRKLPVIYFLSGLGMDHVDFINKSGCQRIASEQGVIIVAPDSSPRNTGIPGEKDKWNIGTKASYYIDCTREPWSKHFRMHSYLSKELPEVIKENFPVLSDKQSIIGFSIGGYGAFLLTMKNPNLFVSTSALAPVCDATKASHSIEGLMLYLGEKETSNWDEWSSITTAEHYRGSKLHFLIDQGTEDEYLKEHLYQKEFLKACESSNISVTYNLREGYIHDYFFIKTFLEDHIKYHMLCLNSKPARM